MTEERLSLGRWGEDQAVRFLLSRRMRILQRNYRAPVGEVDIIARKGKMIAFIEVKTRRGTGFGLPQEAVGPRKQRQIIRTAQWYLLGVKERLQPRFDVIAILKRGEEAQIEYIEDAFTL